MGRQAGIPGESLPAEGIMPQPEDESFDEADYDDPQGILRRDRDAELDAFDPKDNRYKWPEDRR